MIAATRAEAEPNVSVAEALRRATFEAMLSDERVFVMGEGVTDPKAIFGTTEGLLERFGPLRVMEMPIAENGWTGVAIGAALCGQRPVLVHQRVEFALLAMEQLINNAAKMHYVSGGRHRVPLVVRMVVGRGWGQGPAHSQCLTSMFSTIPGLIVVAPSSACDAYELLLAAIADDNPVVFIEHRWIHYASGPLRSSGSSLSTIEPRRLARGEDVTVVASSYMTLETLQAVDELRRHGCSVDLFDLRIVRPLRLNPIIESVRRTGRLVTVEDGHLHFGVGAELTASVVERAFSSLQAPPLRIALPDHPTPSSRALCSAYYPRSPRIAAQIAATAGMSKGRCVEIEAALEGQRDDLPLDVPHPSFRGPF